MATAAVYPPPIQQRSTSYRKTPHIPRASSSQPPPGPVKTVSAPPPGSDPYYDHKTTASLCAGFIIGLFKCPEAMTPSDGTSPAVRLDHFVAYALHRTRLHISVAFAALYLLQRLKARFPAAKGSSGHRLFLSAFMLAAKIMCDDVYSNKSWAIVGQGLFHLRELNQMEREMCNYLEFKLDVDPLALKAFEDRVTIDFGPSPTPSSGTPTKPPHLRTTSVVSASVPFDPSPRKPSAATVIPSLPYYRSAFSPPPGTPEGVFSASTSPASSPSPATPIDAEWARAHHYVRVVEADGSLGNAHRANSREPTPKPAPGRSHSMTQAQGHGSRWAHPIVASVPGPVRTSSTPTVAAYQPAHTSGAGKSAAAAAGGREEYARLEQCRW